MANLLSFVFGNIAGISAVIISIRLAEKYNRLWVWMALSLLCAGVASVSFGIWMGRIFS